MDLIFKKNTFAILTGILTVFLVFMLSATAFCEDTSPPSITKFQIAGEEAVYTSSASVSITLWASDPGGAVTGYYLSENASAMSGDILPPFISFQAPDQIIQSTVSFNLSSGNGTKTVYGWVRDAAGNISSAASDTIILDTEKPAEGFVGLQNASGSVSTRLVTVTVSAKDNFGVAGYRVSEIPYLPGLHDDFEMLETSVTSLNTSFEFTLSNTPGEKTLYAWFIDAAGNISDPVTSRVDLTHGWVRLMGYPSRDIQVNSIAMDPSGNIYLTGLTEGALGGNDNTTLFGSAFVTKLNSRGDILWSRLLETPQKDDSYTYSTRAFHIAADNMGNVYISGEYDYSIVSNHNDSFLARFDSNGNQVWLKTFLRSGYSNVARIFGIGVDSANHLYMLGYTSTTLDLNESITIARSGDNSGNFLAKLDGAGNFIWGYNITMDVLDMNNGIMTVDSGGNAFIFGHARQNSASVLSLSKFNANGTKVWNRLWDKDEDYWWASDISLDSSGDIYLTGSVCPSADCEESNQNVFIAKFDGNSSSQSQEDWLTVLSDDFFRSRAIAVDSRNNSYIAGGSYMHKFNASGSRLWIKHLDIVNNVKLTHSFGDERESVNSVLTGPGDVVYSAGNLTGYFDPGFAGQQDAHMASQVFIWRSGSDSSLDLALPEGTVTINSGSETTLGNMVTLNLNASDNTGITGYYVSESPSIPPPSAFTLVVEIPEFSADIPFSFESPEAGVRTVYVWYRDSFGNFSPKASASINVTGDTDPPVGQPPIIDGGAEESLSATLSIEIAATDNVAVTGYFISEGYTGVPSPEDFIMIDNPSPDFSKTVSFTLPNTTAGNFLIYAWFIDAAGNISSSVTASGKMKDTRPPVTVIDPPSGFYDGPVTITLTATDDSDRYIGDTLFSSVVTYYTIDDGDIQTSYRSDGPASFEITPPAIVKFLSADNYGYSFMGANIEAMQTATYGLAQNLSGSVEAGGTENRFFNASAGSTLRILFSLNDEDTGSPAHIPLSGCGTNLTLLRPDSSVHGTYTHTGGSTEILVTGAYKGEYTLVIERSGCGTATEYEAVVTEAPATGNLPGVPSLANVIRFLQVLVGADPHGVDTSHDTDNDGKIGIPEVIRMLQDISKAQ